ncbi:MAG: photosynthetic complex assembly protein PuhC [Burkholderiales bacterium]|jgi:putative photosynthetic complex assembly protein|nr:photosynthetic complex assembly protein PuhC [Burkholderiales bacterium]
MSEASVHDQVPRGALVGIGILLAVSLVAVTAVRVSGIDVRTPDAEAVMVRELRFEDTANGGVAVIDARSGLVVESFTGEQGFLRGSLRALARERKARGLGPDLPFQLIGRRDGRLTLIDTATGTRIDLESFGPTNAGVFGRLLMKPDAADGGATAPQVAPLASQSLRP